jgi:hypothetical protein
MALAEQTRVHLLSCVALAGFACSAPPVSAVTLPPVVMAPIQPEAPPATEPRLGLATKLGPRVAGGRLALLQGRRVLFEESGRVEREHWPAPWLLADLFAVPSSRGPRIAGTDGNGGLVVFDDPLGAGRVIKAPPCLDQHRGVLPGTIVSLCDDDDATFLVPVDPGATTARLPIDPPEPPVSFPHGLATSVPLKEAASANAGEAAAILHVIGLMVTADGGATWRSPKPEGAPEDVYQASRLRVDAAGLHAVNEAAHTEALVDAARGTLGRFGPPPPSPEDEALWKRLQDLARVETPPEPTPHPPAPVDWGQSNVGPRLPTWCMPGRKPPRKMPRPLEKAPDDTCSHDAQVTPAPGWSFGRLAHAGAGATTELDWYDVTEIGAAVHTWKGALPPPPGSADPPGLVHLADVYPRGNRALLGLCRDGKSWLLRARGGKGGTVETAFRGPFDHRPRPEQVVFGAGDDDPVAWTETDAEHGRRLFVWRSGEGPRAIARVPDWAILGTPTREGVPLLIAPFLSQQWTSRRTRYRGWALVSVVPIPEVTTAPAATPWLRPTGWKMVHGYRPFALPVCAKPAPGLQFVTWTKNVKGYLNHPPTGAHMTEALADLRVSDAGICIAGFFGEAHGEADVNDKPTGEYGHLFARADFVGDRAELGVIDEPGGNMPPLVREGTCR